jgi:MoxR-like ATPase
MKLQERLAMYRDLGYNVMLEGHAGVGKTALINEAFAGLKSKYFSAPTMDPWVDLVGVPRAISDEKRGGQMLDLVRPEFVKADEIEAIFIDELNRAPDKVLNALMELIQFRSINGFKLNKLRLIWAAINPADSEDYTVNELDRAIKDRFQVQIAVPYDVDEAYFKRQFPETGHAFVTWWRDLPKDQQHKISPRRLEYAARAHEHGCTLQDFLPEGVNISKLVASIRSKTFQEQLAEIKTRAAAKAFVNQINNATKLLQLVNAKNKQAIEFFETYRDVMPQELIEALTPVLTNQDKQIVTMQELMNQLKGLKIGDPEITRRVNSVVLSQQHGSVADEIKRLVQAQNSQLKLLASHMAAAMSTLAAGPLKAAMKNEDGSNTNFTVLALLISSNDKTFSFFSKDERKKVNGHTYLLGVAAQKWM